MNLEATFEFHVSRLARDRYQFEQSMFALSGNVILANFMAAREFAQKINAKKNLASFPEQAVKASEINAMGLMDEILHAIVEEYRNESNPEVYAKALGWLSAELGEDELNKLLNLFCDQFPPLKVYQGEISLEAYLSGATEGISNQAISMVELLMLWLSNMNPALSSYTELFDDELLAKRTLYKQAIASLKTFFDTQPRFEGENLIDVLREPALKHPHSLTAQLGYMMNRFARILGSRFFFRILGSLDFIKEESRIIIGTGGGSVSPVIEFGATYYDEPEAFSPDRDWMPSLVLMAKNAYVWLDQLSKQYQRRIASLDEIPDEELDRLARFGFTGLWLIGLWERSRASQTIKQLCGNPDAVASAYSLYDYVIAADLGGESAYQKLRERAWQRGIRLSADMVPNHVGIYSKWVIEHPDWFISLPYSPYPNYTFNGVDLSDDARVGIFLEDHYYSRNDAAVVFKRVDRWTGSEMYIYHGNDGTSMPWNDTAQLNYLNPEVREAVIQTILHVARKFSVIRFDAAMTLAKKHYQRLWFPEPGSGGDIPTRAEFGLTKAQFDAAIPVEFWREVVDRVAQEAPDTLLLAEAFWLMEGYFVRTLGMHRVYNSAFMNMLRDEKNQEYRLVIKNTLEFDPEILKRYVNFMNNPDEKTAVDQFGKGDKYFGIATLLATMPGLPMFGHGQIEGYTEKYGMEYRRAYWDEYPDPYLVDRHAREISPLLQRRYLFAEVGNFLLYDYFMPNGQVNEDVFAFTNQSGSEHALVVYHNRFASTQGYINYSAAHVQKNMDGEEKKLVQKRITDGLGIIAAPNMYTIFRDYRTGLEYLRSNQELVESGLYLELNAYECHVYMDFRQVVDNEWQHYANLAGYLSGRGVPSIDIALRELFLRPVHTPFKELVNAGQWDWLYQNRLMAGAEAEPESFDRALDEVQTKAVELGVQVLSFMNAEGDAGKFAEEIRKTYKVILSLEKPERYLSLKTSSEIKKSVRYLLAGLGPENRANWAILFAWAAARHLGALIYPVVDKPETKIGSDLSLAVQQSRTWMDEWILSRLVGSAMLDYQVEEAAIRPAQQTLDLLISLQNWHQTGELTTEQTARQWFANPEMQRYLLVNRHNGVLWFNKEKFEQLVWWAFAIAVIGAAVDAVESDQARKVVGKVWKVIQKLLTALDESGYQVEKLIESAG